MSGGKPAFCSQTHLHSKPGCFILAVTSDNYLTFLGLALHLENRLKIPTSQGGCEGQTGSVCKTRPSSVTGLTNVPGQLPRCRVVRWEQGPPSVQSPHFLQPSDLLWLPSEPFLTSMHISSHRQSPFFNQLCGSQWTKTTGTPQIPSRR